MVEIRETLETWPQLGSAVPLGGALTTDVARRLLLGQLTHSGRYYVDLETLVHDGTEVPLVDARAEDRPLPETFRPSPPIPRPTRTVKGSVSVEEARYVAAHGLLAPSGGNAQPWRFILNAQRRFADLDPGRSRTLLDFQYRGSYLAFGAAAENMDLAARDLGLRADIVAFPEPDNPLLVFQLRLTPDPASRPEPVLFEQVRLRVTNRRLGQRLALAEEDRLALSTAARARNSDLALLTEPGSLSNAFLDSGRPILLGLVFRDGLFTEKFVVDLDEIVWEAVRSQPRIA